MDKQIVSKAVGIDLGTTNSAVAVMNKKNTEIIIHKDENTRRESTPSCVWKDPITNEVVVGHEAFIRIGTTPTPIKSIKRLMGQQAKVKLTNEELTPEQISACILKEMKRQIEEKVKKFSTDKTEWIVDRAVITVPAYFDQPQIEATFKAGELAGLEVLELLHEPTSSAIYYCWKNNVRNGVFLVYDLGGGTFDVAVLRCTEGAFEVLGISGNRFLGGDDMDRVIAEDLQGRLLKEGYALELDVKNDPDDSLKFDILKFLAEDVKKALSPLDAREYLLRDTVSLKDNEGLPVCIDTTYTISEIETLIRPIVERTIPYCFDALEQASKKANVKLSEVDAIILTGGPSNIHLVQDIVRQHLCSPIFENVIDERARQPRAKCTELVVDENDSMVVMGAAIRAAASGGLAVYNPAKTVRITFLIKVMSAKDCRMGGKVEVLDPDINIVGGHIKLIIPDVNYEDENNLKENGIFAFKWIPLKIAAENMLTFEVYDRLGKLVITARLPIMHTTEEARPTGECMLHMVLPKTIHLEVLRDGEPSIKELVPALSKLPFSRDFTLPYPRDTEIIVLPIYQHKRKIKKIKVKVHSSLPKGTPLKLNIRVDKLYNISVKCKTCNIYAKIEPQQDRDIPSEQEIKALDNNFNKTLTYLPGIKKSVAETRYVVAKLDSEMAAKHGDTSQAVNDFEEMEELVAEISHTSGSIQPPKVFFDELVGECLEINQYIASIAAKAGKPHDSQELAKVIEVQRIQGEKAYEENDQNAYSEAMKMLESIRNYLIGLYLYQKVTKSTKNEGMNEEKAAAHLQYIELEQIKNLIMRGEVKYFYPMEIYHPRECLNYFSNYLMRDKVGNSRKFLGDIKGDYENFQANKTITCNSSEVRYSLFEDRVSDSVNFTLTAPSTLIQGNYYEICVWAYLSEQEQRMRKEAQKFHDTENLIEKSKKSVPVQRRSIIAVFLDIPYFNIDDPLDTIYWDGDIANASFMVGIPADISTGRHKGKVILRVEGLQIAKLDFMLSVGIEEMKASSILVNQKLVNSAFASYASEDRNEVLARIQGIQKVRPDMDIFMDVVSLRSGDYWEIRLTEEIKKRDIFYLFWSEASSKSVYVNKEWHTALASKGIDFISPVPLVSPAEVPPPQELASLHFNDWILAFRSYRP